MLQKSMNHMTGGRAADVGSDRSVSTLPAPTDAERQRVLVEWNDTAVNFPGKTLCLHQLIEEQVKRTPNQVALVFEQHRFTYDELNRRADQLALHLRNLGARPDVVIGLLVERSVETVVGILGILKAGAAYLPIEPHYPPERIAFILGDAQAKLLVTQTSLLGNLPTGVAQTVCRKSVDLGGR